MVHAVIVHLRIYFCSDQHPHALPYFLPLLRHLVQLALVHDIGFEITAGAANVIFRRGLHRQRGSEGVEGILLSVPDSRFGFVHSLVPAFGALT